MGYPDDAETRPPKWKERLPANRKDKRAFDGDPIAREGSEDFLVKNFLRKRAEA